NVRLSQHTIMTAGDEMKVYAASGEFTPAEVFVVDSVMWLSTRAKHSDATGKRGRHKVAAGEVEFHRLLFAFGSVREIRVRGFVTVTLTFNLFPRETELVFKAA